MEITHVQEAISLDDTVSATVEQMRAELFNPADYETAQDAIFHVSFVDDLADGAISQPGRRYAEQYGPNGSPAYTDAALTVLARSFRVMRSQSDSTWVYPGERAHAGRMAYGDGRVVDSPRITTVYHVTYLN